MKKKIAVLGMTGLLVASSAWGSGYRIPEQSVNSTALSAAYVANAKSADASYFNPANMGWMNKDSWSSDLSLTYINLAKIEYSDSRSSAYNGESKAENFLLPQIHLVSPDLNNFRLGLSIVEPAGLSKRWEQPFPRTFAEDFTLKVVELNPSVSYTMANKYGVAAGVRVLRSTGQVTSRGTIRKLTSELTLLLPEELLESDISRSMEGDSIDYGYNIAITAKASNALSFAATYRSKVKLGLESDTVELTTTGFTHSSGYPLVLQKNWVGAAQVSVPVPAVLTLAGAYTFGKTTVELTWDRTFWSAYDNLDFEYDLALGNDILEKAFDDPKDKSWTNTDAYRIGVTHQLNDDVTLMVGFGYDENPVPERTLNFELPDSNALLFSLGGRYRINDQLEIGAAYLYDHKDSRTVTNNEAAEINGTFDNAAAHLLSLGASLNF